MNEKEKHIQERRDAKAINENLKGPSGKLGTIVKFLGQPIVSEGSGYCESTPMDQPWILEEEGQQDVRMWEDDVVSTTVGWAFDGLSRGVHMEIKYLERKAELSVTYKGYPVYSEVDNSLELYNPFPEWEDHIARFYETASILKNKYRVEEQKELSKIEKIETQNLINRLRAKWGIFDNSRRD